ncbi:FIG00554508: hypothetical protein [Cronobacter universalis NCTC 9529]|nr:FIG00554508: hypothetical protein [Cronobacter universalis NCTC 9529]
MRELCANTIYKFVNRFSFVAKEVAPPTRQKSAKALLFFLPISQLT